MNLEKSTKEKMIIQILSIIEKGNEAVIRKRSKNGEEYIEIAEQKFKIADKCILHDN